MKRTILNLQWSTVLGVFLSVCTACGHKTGNGTGTTDSIPMAAAPEFNADSAFAYTAAQCAFGPRVPNTEAHRLCGTYIAEKFKSFGATVTDQYADVKAYDGTVLKARNIIASYNPDAKARILICGHWDSRPWADNDPDSANWHKPVLAANDAASDVAVMLEMALLIQLHPIEIGIDFNCFDAEDYGVPQWSDQAGDASSWCLGSQYWAANPHVYGYQARFGILMDMVGGRGSTFSKEGYSQRYASQVVDLVWNTAAQLGYGQFFPMRDGGYITDDHVPVNEIAGIPCIDIIPYFTDAPSGFGPTWHTVNDNMEHIDRQVLKAVGQTVTQVIYNENQ